MNLISCDNCGVVLDKDKLRFPEEIWDDDGQVIFSRACWDGEKFAPYVPCPVCGNEVTK